MTRSQTSSQNLLVGVDVGGSKVAVLVVDEQHQVRGRTAEPMDVSSPELSLASIVTAIRRGVALAHASMDDVAAVGLGIPGRVNAQTGVVRMAINLKWHELPVGALLSDELGVACFLENDVRTAAVGLRNYSGAAAVKNLAYVSVGTGIAAGLILNGRLYRGAHGMAGEIGHMIMDPDGPRCQCGAWGCLEALAAGPAIARLGRQAVEAGADTLLCDARPLTAASVYQAAQAGDAVAQAITERVGRTLGRALQQLIMAYDVEHIVLGGGVSRAGEAFLQPIVRELDRQRRDSALAREMLLPETIDLLSPDYDAGPWGAVALAYEGRQTARLDE